MGFRDSCSKNTQAELLGMRLGHATMVDARHMPIVSVTPPSRHGVGLHCHFKRPKSATFIPVSNSGIKLNLRVNNAMLGHHSRSRFTTESSRRDAVTLSVQKASSCMHNFSVFCASPYSRIFRRIHGSPKPLGFLLHCLQQEQLLAQL